MERVCAERYCRIRRNAQPLSCSAARFPATQAAKPEQKIKADISPLGVKSRARCAGFGLVPAKNEQTLVALIFRHNLYLRLLPSWSRPRCPSPDSGWKARGTGEQPRARLTSPKTSSRTSSVRSRDSRPSRFIPQLVMHYLDNHSVAGWPSTWLRLLENRLPHCSNSLLYRGCGRGCRAATTTQSLPIYFVHDHLQNEGGNAYGHHHFPNFGNAGTAAEDPPPLR